MTREEAIIYTIMTNEEVYCDSDGVYCDPFRWNSFGFMWSATGASMSPAAIPDGNYEAYSKRKPKREFPFKPFDKVLVRDGDFVWHCAFYSHINPNESSWVFVCTGESMWDQIASYSGNEDKVGTTDDISDKWTAEDIK